MQAKQTETAGKRCFKKKKTVLQSTRGFGKEEMRGGVWGCQPAGWGGTRRELWTLPWSSGGETARVMRTEREGGRGEDRVGSPLCTERWRLNQRAGVRQRSSVLLRRRNDGEESAPRSSEEESCQDFTFASPDSKWAAASWLITAGLVVRMNFLLIGVTEHNRGCSHETAINDWTYNDDFWNCTYIVSPFYTAANKCKWVEGLYFMKPMLLFLSFTTDDQF